jgi:hypothetical protein
MIKLQVGDAEFDKRKSASLFHFPNRPGLGKSERGTDQLATQKLRHERPDEIG